MSANQNLITRNQLREKQKSTQIRAGVTEEQTSKRKKIYVAKPESENFNYPSKNSDSKVKTSESRERGVGSSSLRQQEIKRDIKSSEPTKKKSTEQTNVFDSPVPSKRVSNRLKLKKSDQDVAPATTRLP